MPNLNKKLKPQYEKGKESIISSQESKVDKSREFSRLSKIIDKSKKLEESFKYLV